MVATKRHHCKESLENNAFLSLVYTKVKNCVAEAALVVVLNVDYSVLFQLKHWEKLPAAALNRGVLGHLQY